MWGSTVQENRSNQVRGDQTEYYRQEMTPGRKAAILVLQQAVEDLQSFRFMRASEDFYSRTVRGTVNMHAKAYVSAHLWVASEGRSEVFAFENICDALGLNADAVRAKLGVSTTDSFFGVKTLPVRESGT